MSTSTKISDYARVINEIQMVFKRNLTLLDLQMIHSVAFNMTSGASASTVNKAKAERPDLQTAAGCSPAGMCLRGRALLCLYVGLWSSEGAPTVHGPLEMPFPAPSSYWPSSSSDSCISMAPQERICRDGPPL